MTTADRAFLEGVVDDLAPLGVIEKRPYFGGVGLVCNHRQFASVMGAALYMATDGHTRESMRNQGARPFEYMTKLGLRTVEAYYDTPAEVLGEPELLIAWARRALSRKVTGTNTGTRTTNANDSAVQEPRQLKSSSGSRHNQHHPALSGEAHRIGQLRVIPRTSQDGLSLAE